MTNEKGQGSAATPASSNDKALSRRGLFKKLMFGAAAVGVAGGTAKVADSMLPETDLQKAYAMDVTPGNKIIAEREHVLMSRKEKQSMVQMFVEDYEKSRSET